MASATHEELTLIRESVLLPFLLSIVDRNISDLNNGKTAQPLLQRLYVAAATALKNDIEADLILIKKTLKDQAIRVWEDDKRAREDGARYYRFACRGYEDSFGIMREIAKAEVGSRLKAYVQRIGETFGKAKI